VSGIGEGKLEIGKRIKYDNNENIDY